MRVRVRGLVPRENNRSLSAKRWNKFARVSGSAEGRGEAVCLNGVYPLTDLSEFLIRNTRPSCVSICIYIYNRLLHFIFFSFFPSNPIPVAFVFFIQIFHPTKTRKDSFSGGEIWRNCGKKGLEEGEGERREAIMSDTRQYPPSAIGQKFTWRGN